MQPYSCGTGNKECILIVFYRLTVSRQTHCWIHLALFRGAQFATGPNVPRVNWGTASRCISAYNVLPGVLPTCSSVCLHTYISSHFCTAYLPTLKSLKPEHLFVICVRNSGEGARFARSPMEGESGGPPTEISPKCCNQSYS